MNIFFLHQSPIIAAQEHADIHVGKMLLESCQLLATAHHELGNGAAVTYKPTHKNHPCAVWVRQSRTHYAYVSDLAFYLAREFRKRFGKAHKCEEILNNELRLPPPALTSAAWSKPPQAMPEEFRGDDHIEAYKRYYASKADTMAMRWRKSEENAPWWFIVNRNNYLAQKGLYVNSVAHTEQVSV